MKLRTRKVLRITGLLTAIVLIAAALMLSSGCTSGQTGPDPEKTDVVIDLPTDVPGTDAPATDAVTDAPEVTATEGQTEPAGNPTDIPATDVPETDRPTAVTGTAAPSEVPSETPVPPTSEPDPTPGATPTKAPTATPTATPAPTPTKAPTATPTPAPTPTKAPTATTTEKPTATPAVDPNKLSDADQARAENLLTSATNVVPAINNSALTAADEDNDITVWFDHSYNNTPADSTTPTEFKAYQIKLAKNEIEGCHFMVASKAAKSGITLEVSPFKDGSGNVLESEICYGWYFDGVDGKTVADPIPVLEHEFDLKANKSQMFIIKVISQSDTPAGQYSAVITLKDAGGNEIKKASVYAYVWNFALPVTSSCKTLTDLNEWAVIVGANREGTTQDGLEDDLYALYYEYLLENKMCCYTLPYAKRGQFWDSRVEQYLDDPRMTAYTLCWKIHPDATQNDTYLRAYVEAAYNVVSKKQEWLDKAYFYPNEGDEPLSAAAMNKIKHYNSIYTEIFGAHKLIIPMHYNTNVSSGVDFFKYLENDVNVWCPKTYFFNTQADKAYTKNLYTNYYGATYEKQYGVFKDRMAAQQAEGDEVWWYITRFPHNPEITLSINDESVKHRLLFWQQKLYDIDGFLYYMVNDWENSKTWTKKYEHQVSGTVVDTYGNGVLIYPGGALQEYIDKYGSDGYPGPIGSLRLESVRDGVEDYDYFTLLDSLYGEGTSDLIIKQITTSLGVYSTDTDLFTELRTAVGNLIAAKS
ncbi:MAG: DUF4091 domain-containing protein [Clostridia bacterium]|nr:DUF4091 domain-containing protein [Clostridia bacterium]